MTPDELDRVLSHDEEIVPSSGLAASVMDLVRSEASAPDPIPFPWRRLALGITAGVGLAAWLAWSGAMAPFWGQVLSLSPESWIALLKDAGGAAVRTGAAWTVAALLIAGLSTGLALRLASPRA